MERKNVQLQTDHISIKEIIKLLIVLVVTVLIVRAAYGMTKNAMQATQSQKEYSKKLQSLEDQKTFLENTLSKIDTEGGRESYIRKELRVVKPNEHMFVVQE